jgi:hypothetical protein
VHEGSEVEAEWKKALFRKSNTGQKDSQTAPNEQKKDPIVKVKEVSKRRKPESLVRCFRLSEGEI